jgi:hypothetical protein
MAVPAVGGVVVLERHALAGRDRQRPLGGDGQGHQKNEQQAR